MSGEVEPARRPGALFASVAAAKAELAEIARVDEAAAWIDKAEVAKVYARSVLRSREAQNHAAHVSLLCQRRAGELLAETPTKANQWSAGDTLSQALGVESETAARALSSRWQRLASIPEELFSAAVEEVKAKGELTTAGLLRAVDPRLGDLPADLASSVRSGEMTLARAERIARDREAADRRVEEARRQAEERPAAFRVDIRHGDFRDVLADLADVDAIITDPPYPARYLPLLADLAAWADKVLASEGVLAVLIGQTHLPEVYRLLDGHRPYRWTCCYLTEGPGYVSFPRRVQSNWKPLLLYGGGPRLADVIRSEGLDAAAKSHHRWGQDYAAFEALVGRLTSPAATVVDPFMGSGTTLLAAHSLGRHAVGADIDLEAVATARERLA